MSFDETSKLAPPVQRNLAEMVSGLKTDIGNAADQVGRAADYYQGLERLRQSLKIPRAGYGAVKDSIAKQGAKTKTAAAGARGAVGAGTVYGL